MKKGLFKSLMAIVFLVAGSQAQAAVVLTLGPGDAVDSGNETSTSVIDAYVESTYGVTEVYKSDVSGTSGTGSDSGSFASSYNTTFSNSASDPMDALIEYVSGPTIDCPTCYLLVKDGNQKPAWYLLSLGDWDGEMSIDLQDFLPNQGAISHVTIYRGDGEVPVPAPLVVMAIGLVGMLGMRRMKRTV